MLRPVCIVTGASAGIGAALAQVFAANGHELVLAARRERELQALADTIDSQGQPRPLVLPIDLSQPAAGARIAQQLAAHGLEPQYVVNNAGFGLAGPAMQLNRDEQLAMIDVNVRALVDLSLAFLDSLVRRQGGILNVASVAGFLPGPGMAVYYASKAFVLSFSDALARELAGTGVRVTTLCPGPVATEFQARAGSSEPGGFLAGMFGRSAQDVALAGYRGLMAGRRCVVPGWTNKLVTLLPRFFPRGLVAYMVAQAQLRRLDK